MESYNNYLKMKNKVYCISCKYYQPSIEFCHAQCHSPNNFKDTYLQKNSQLKNSPEEKNKKNTCKDFKEKESLFKNLINFLKGK